MAEAAEPEMPAERKAAAGPGSSAAAAAAAADPTLFRITQKLGVQGGGWTLE